MLIPPISARSVVLLILVVFTVRELLRGRILRALVSLSASVFFAVYQNLWQQITSLQLHYDKRLLLLLAAGVVCTAFIFRCLLAPAASRPRARRPQHPGRYRNM